MSATHRSSDSLADPAGARRLLREHINSQFQYLDREALTTNTTFRVFFLVILLNAIWLSREYIFYQGLVVSFCGIIWIYRVIRNSKERLQTTQMIEKMAFFDKKRHSYDTSAEEEDDKAYLDDIIRINSPKFDFGNRNILEPMIFALAALSVPLAKWFSLGF